MTVPAVNVEALRRQLTDLIADGLASRDGHPAHHVEASDLLAGYVTALDVFKARSIPEGNDPSTRPAATDNRQMGQVTD